MNTQGKGDTVLIEAATGSNLACLNLLTKIGVDVNAHSAFHINVLMAALIDGFTDCAKALIYAVCKVHARHKSLIVRKGADLFTRNNKGNKNTREISKGNTTEYINIKRRVLPACMSES